MPKEKRSYRSDPDTARREVDEFCAQYPRYRAVTESIRELLREREFHRQADRLEFTVNRPCR